MWSLSKILGELFWRRWTDVVSLPKLIQRIHVLKAWLLGPSFSKLSLSFLYLVCGKVKHPSHLKWAMFSMCPQECKGGMWKLWIQQAGTSSYKYKQLAFIKSLLCTKFCRANAILCYMLWEGVYNLILASFQFYYIVGDSNPNH